MGRAAPAVPVRKAVPVVSGVPVVRVALVRKVELAVKAVWVAAVLVEPAVKEARAARVLKEVLAG